MAKINGAVVALALVACGSPTGRQAIVLEVTTDRALYGPGSEVRVTLTNRGSGGLAYNECYAVLERRVAERWEVTAPAVDAPCRDYALGLGPGRTAVISYLLPPTLGASDCRYVFTSVRDESNRLLPLHERSSNPFGVVVRD